VASVSRVPGNAAALALIVLPVLAFAIRIAQPGWGFVGILLISPVLFLMYALAVVIAATGLLGSKAAFLLSRVRWRGITAAWISACSSLVVSALLIDPDPNGPPSLRSEAESAVFGFFTVTFLLLGVAAFVWLTVEWIVALHQRRKRSTPISI